MACESLPYFADFSENLQSGKIGEGRSLPANARGLERTGVIGNTWRIPWGSLVHTYSRTALTVQTDKMVGVAKAFSMQHPDDEYLAGLWRANLVAQMPWIAMKTEPHDKYIASSWSWASVDGWIQPSRIHYKQVSAFQEVQTFLDCHLQDQDSGQQLHLASGTLTLQGPIMEIRIGKISESMSMNPFMPAAQGRLRSMEATPVEQEVWLDFEPVHDIWAEQLYFLPLLLTPKLYVDPTELHGVLLRMEPSKGQTFSRVGYSVVGDLDWTKRAMMPLEVTSLSGFPFDAEKGYTINII